MGCMDQGSNFNHVFFRDGEWYASWGLDPTWEGPLEAIQQRFPDYQEPTFTYDGMDFSAEQNDRGIATVRFLGRTPLVNAE